MYQHFGNLYLIAKYYKAITPICDLHHHASVRSPSILFSYDENFVRLVRFDHP